MPSFRRNHSPLLAPSNRRLLDPADVGIRTSPTGGALAWILEALEDDPTYAHRQMFGCEAAYLDGRIYLVTASKREPWNGLLVCTSIDRQPSLRAEWPALAPHRVLGKWLYISQLHSEFERVTQSLIRHALARDSRLGVEPKARKRKQRMAAQPATDRRRSGKSPKSPPPAAGRKTPTRRTGAARRGGVKKPRNR